MLRYDTEREGQLDFYRTFLERVDPDLTPDDVIKDDNDGVVRGNILEFKLSVANINSALFQAVKYLSRRRIKGKPVTSNILIVDLSEEICWVFKSEQYLAQIEQVYTGPASRHDDGFIAGQPYRKLRYGVDFEAEELVQILREDNYVRIHIDENCVVGWARTFYRMNPGSRKEDFIGDRTGKHKTQGEIRNPSALARYILPYEGKSNVKFGYLMDKLNDDIMQRDLGAYYTPMPYVKKAQDLLMEAISRVPEGNDYVIIDRCAGTGNLELGLPEEILSHCILSTIEYYEYRVMIERLGHLVRTIIPPAETSSTYVAGLVKGSDALTRAYVQHPIIKEYLDKPDCTVILYENVPFSEPTSTEHQKKKKSKKSSRRWKRSWVTTQMKKCLKTNLDVSAYSVNDLGNIFIWSGFKYYLRQPTDSYVVFSPIKYWKAQNLVNKKILDGFAGNRKHFHATKPSCVPVILWANQEDNRSSFELPAYDIAEDGNTVVPEGKLKFEKVHARYSKYYYDKRTFEDDSLDGVLLDKRGFEASTQKKRLKPRYNDNILGYMVVDGFGFDSPDQHSILVSAGVFNGNGFYLRKDSYLERLPMFAASRLVAYDGKWTMRGRIMKTADGAEQFFADVSSGKLDRWLLQVLLFTCVEYQNHMKSFYGTDERFYRNELCLDTTNGKTVASCKLEALKFNDQEREIIEAWQRVLDLARGTEKYRSDYTYGLYQIGEELNENWKDEESGNIVYKYPELNGAIATLKSLVGSYWREVIEPLLFKYKFLV